MARPALSTPGDLQRPNSLKGPAKGEAFMAKQQRTGKRSSGKPVTNQTPEAELRDRLAQAKRYDDLVAVKRKRESEAWKETAQQFEKIASHIPSFTVPEEWKRAVAKSASLLPPLKPMSGKVWLEGSKNIKSGFKRFPRRPGESKKAWSRRLAVEASKERVAIKASGIETRIHERRRGAKQ